jgi:hypothetical protein
VKLKREEMSFVKYVLFHIPFKPMATVFIKTAIIGMKTVNLAIHIPLKVPKSSSVLNAMIIKFLESKTAKTAQITANSVMKNQEISILQMH